MNTNYLKQMGKEGGNSMKIWETVTILLMCLALVSLTTCGGFGDSGQEETGPQLVEVMRGDLTFSVSGNGNIEAANEVRLVFGTNGRIEKIMENDYTFYEYGGKTLTRDLMVKMLGKLWIVNS